MKKILSISIILSVWCSAYGQGLQEHRHDDPLVRSLVKQLETIMRIAGSTKMPEFEHRLAFARFDALSSPRQIILRSPTIGRAEFHSQLRLPRKIRITPPAYAEGIETRMSTVQLTDKAEAIARTMDRDDRYLILTETLPVPDQHLVQFGFKIRLRIAPSVGSLNTVAVVSLDDRTGELRSLDGYIIQSWPMSIDPARVTTTFTNAQLRSTAIGLFLALRPFDNVIEGISGLNYHIPSGSTGEEIGYYRGLGWLTPEHHQLRASSTGTLIYEIRFADAANRKKVVTIKLDACTNSPMSYLCVDWRGMGLAVEEQEPPKQKIGVTSIQLRDADGIAIPIKIVNHPVKTGETVPCIVEIDRSSRVIGAIDFKTGYGRFSDSTGKRYFKADRKLLAKLVKPMNNFVSKK